MITISLCMIVKNEESFLARCLDSVKDLVEEIIIVDTGSTDKTKEIAYKYTNKVYDFCWVNDFSLARNYAFSKATKDYQMWIDADDVITEDSRSKILELKRNLKKEIDIVTFKYITHYDKYGDPILISTRGRLFKREKNYLWKESVHEYIGLCGKIFYADDIFISHKKESSSGDRNLKIYESKIQKGENLSPRGTYYFARELKDNKRYVEAIYYFKKFLDSNLGWIEDNISTCFNMSICYELLKDDEKILPILLKSFQYDSPRAEIICQIGYYYLNNNDYKKAADWFLIAANLENSNTLGFKLTDYWGYIPNIELAVCYYKLGHVDKAILHNEKALKIKPKSQSAINNKNFFEKLEKNV